MSVHASGISLRGILPPGGTRDSTEGARLDSKHTLSLPPTFMSLYNHHVLWSLPRLLQPHIGLALPTLSPPRQAPSSASRVSLCPFVRAPSELLRASEWMSERCRDSHLNILMSSIVSMETLNGGSTESCEIQLINKSDALILPGRLWFCTNEVN